MFPRRYPYLKSISATATMALMFAVSACGTTYSLPEVSDAANQHAKQIFSEEAHQATSVAGTRKSEDEAAYQFLEVVDRVVPVAEDFCRQEMSENPSFDCTVRVYVDQEMPVRNAYQTYTENGDAIIAFSLPMIADARNEDEIAFVLGHEVGHHVGAHIEKQKQQATATALALGALMAVGQAYAAQGPYYNPVQAQQDIQNVIAAGYALGNQAFSQSYELEADVIGAYIATTAGYDAVRGARFFARPEAEYSTSGQLSFWGTHPPDEERVATVISIVEKIKNGEGLQRK